jgi:hypothetical protein
LRSPSADLTAPITERGETVVHPRLATVAPRSRQRLRLAVVTAVALGALIALCGAAYAVLGAHAARSNTANAAPTAPAASAASDAATSTGKWDKIAACETGGDWNTDTGNGYYGGLQFNVTTWHDYGGQGLPHQASKATQITIAEKVLAKQGWKAWPVCSRKAGLR